MKCRLCGGPLPKDGKVLVAFSARGQVLRLPLRLCYKCAMKPEMFGLLSELVTRMLAHLEEPRQKEALR